jgi:hypothetical protein
MKQLLFFVFSLTVCWKCVASESDSVVFKIDAPDSVQIGVMFRLVYELNTDDVQELKFPDFDGLSVKSGPSKASSFSTAFVNGVVTKEVRITYTFFLVAEKEGDLSIPPATMLIDGKSYQCNATVLKAVKQLSGNKQPQFRNRQEENPQQKPRKERSKTIYV